MASYGFVVRPCAKCPPEKGRLCELPSLDWSQARCSSPARSLRSAKVKFVPFRFSGCKMAVTCPACSKTFQVGAEHAGKTLKCPCGTKITVPGGAPKPATASPPTAAAPKPATAPTSGAATKISVQCECGNTMQAPATAAGKAVRCKCGKAVPIPGKSAAAVVGGAPKTSVASIAGSNPVPNIDFGSPSSSSPLFALSETDWKVAETKPELTEDKPKKKAVNPYMAQAAESLSKDSKERKRTAGSELQQSRLILIGIGALKLALSIFFLLRVSADVEAIMLEDSSGIDPDKLRFALQLIEGLGIGIASCMILCGILVFMLPLTCSISALVLYVLSEILSIIMNPFQLFNIRAWIIKGVIFGALVQAVNNAGYYRYMKSKQAKE